MACRSGCDCDTCFVAGIGGPARGTPWYASVVPSGKSQAQSIIRVTLDVDGTFTSGTDDTACTTVIAEDKDYEYDGIHEAAVVKFGDCWVMAYTTGIPQGYTGSMAPTGVTAAASPGYPTSSLPFP